MADSVVELVERCHRMRWTLETPSGSSGPSGPSGPSSSVTDELLPWCCRLALWTKARLPPGDATLVLGIAGAQGAGKTTFQRLLTGVLTHALDVPSLGLSIDDLYLTRNDRAALAKEVSPLFATRGAPGTHDTALGVRLFRELRRATPRTETTLPSFDKTTDERRPESEWPRYLGRPRVVVFEGWCVGAIAESDDELAVPVNDFERDSDPDLRFRRYANDRLRTSYAELFRELDALVLLKVPGAEYAFTWRLEAEQEARERLEKAGGDTSRLMDEAGIRRFVQQDERVTRHMLREMPTRANVVFELGVDHRIKSSRFDGEVWLPD